MQQYLDKVGFNLVGYGCTTCIGNSGPLPEPVSEAIDEGDLAVCAVLSGNRNFEGRIHAQVRANYLASPPLVVAYALAGIDPAQSDDRAARRGQRRQAGLSARHLAVEPGGQRHGRAVRSRARASSAATATCSRGRRNGARSRQRRPDLRVRGPLDLSRAAALFREHAEGAGPDPGRVRRARAGDLRRQHHDRPHLAGRQHPPREPGRRIPDQLSGAPGGFQHLRRAARQPSRDDARHLRQYPHHATRWCPGSRAA